MAILDINNGESGLSARGKINNSFDRGNKTYGFGTFVDNVYTSASPLSVTAGSNPILPNNAASGISSYLPSGSSGLYNGSRLVGDSVGDEYSLRISFTAYTTSNNGSFNITCDISAAGDGSNIIASIPQRMLRGTGVGNAQIYTLSIPYLTLGTFLANGGLLRLESVTGTTSIYDISYYIRKESSGEYI